jgi:methylenetetrahydrofolate/methylenetetrahydromethanopterin dehydrogenase (NADP+)
MKKILLQLDTDKHASAFDRFVAYDAGVDEVLSYSGVTPADVANLVQGAMFTRGPEDLKNTAVWIGGSDVAAGEQMLAETRKCFFGPFQVSAMIDSNGCNTTAAAAVALLKKRPELAGGKAVVIGLGGVGQRAALLLARAGFEVIAATIPSAILGDRYTPGRGMRGVVNLRNLNLPNLTVVEAPEWPLLAQALDGAKIALASAPAGIQVLKQEYWAAHPSLQVLVDFNLAEPLGIEGLKPADKFKERAGKLTLGPIAIGNPKMKVHKACVAKLFEANTHVFDTESIYSVAEETI